MPIQVPDHFRAQVIFPHKTAMERDSMVNTFHFRNDSIGGIPNIFDSITERLRIFYCENGAGNSAAVNIMGYIHTAYLQPTIKIYDLGLPEPREATERQWADTGVHKPAATSNPFPTEVSVCLSWRTAVIPPKIGKPGKRGRGRTYIGGLTQSAAVVDGTTSTVRPTFALRSLLAYKGYQLAQPASGPGFSDCQLVVLSTTYVQTDEVTGGWCDDAFDTQRRRGVEPGSRVTFARGAPPA